MRGLGAWLRLLRPLNLVLIAVTPPALWATLVRPLPTSPQLTFTEIALVGLAVSLVAAGGNVVNDIADRTIDALNGRPNPLNGSLSLPVAWATYAAITLGAVLLTWQLAVDLDRAASAVLLPLAVLALLGYAFALKCTPWLGNLTVAGFCAGVPGIVVLAEPTVVAESQSLLSQSLFAYVGFAFFGTWARELVKDLEDRAGDAAAGCRPLAVRWGPGPTTRVVAVAMFGALCVVAWLAATWGLAGEWVGALSWAGLWALLSAILWQVDVGGEATDYTATSRYLKLAIVFGLAFLLLGGAGAAMRPAMS